MLTGRTVQQRRILGTIEELLNVLGSLEVHGIAVDKIVVATPADRLSPTPFDVLSEVEKSSDIVVRFLSERLGLEDPSRMDAVAVGDAGTVARQAQVTAAVPH